MSELIPVELTRTDPPVLLPPVQAAITRDRIAQATDPAVRRTAVDILRQHLAAQIPVDAGLVRVDQVAAAILAGTMWIRPVADDCDCGSAGGQGLVPLNAEHADDCPAALDAPAGPAQSGQLDPTPEDIQWAREWIVTAVTGENARYAEMFVLIGVKSWLDDAAREAAAGEREEADRSVVRARALIAALDESRGSR